MSTPAAQYALVGSLEKGDAAYQQDQDMCIGIRERKYDRQGRIIAIVFTMHKTVLGRTKEYWVEWRTFTNTEGTPLRERRAFGFDWDERTYYRAHC